MRQDEWDAFQHAAYRILAILAFFTNVVLVQLILYHSPKSLGTYKYLMICISLFETLYEALDLAASPDMYTNNSAFLVVVSARKSPFPVSALLSINLLYCAFFGTSLAIFAVHFIYRYLVVIGHKEWIVQTPRNVTVWLLAPLLFGTVWVLTARIFISPEPSLDFVLREEMMTHYGMSVAEIAYCGPYFYPKNEEGVETINWKAIQGMVLFVVMISITLSTMFYFGVRSYRHINGALVKSTRSERFKQLQSQLLSALVLQTVIPLLLMHLPISFCFLLPFFSSSRDIFGRFLTTSIAVYPVLDPLPNMFLIKDYRNAMLRRIRKVMVLSKTGDSMRPKESSNGQKI